MTRKFPWRKRGCAFGALMDSLAAATLQVCPDVRRDAGFKAHSASLRACAAARPAGETLLEVITAVSILLLVIYCAGNVIVTSIRGRAANRNDLAAASLAQEGVEMLRNIRDTNLLRFSSKPECWNAKAEDSVTIDNCGDEVNKIAAGQYRLNREMDSGDSSYLYAKLEKSADAALSAGLTEANDGYFRLKLDADGGGATFLYNHSNGRDTLYYRQIDIEYAELNADGQSDAMKAFSSVKYRLGAETRSINRSIVLFNKP